MTPSIRGFYADWAGYNRRVAEALGTLEPDDLGLIVQRSDPWPIWAVAGHTVAARVHWLCTVLGEPGREATPFPDPDGLAWEDDLSIPHSAREVADAYAVSWRLIAGCLDRWTTDALWQELPFNLGSGSRVHTRQSILMRLINHDAFHAGEISLTLVANGREPIDLWPAADWAADAPRSLREG